MLCVTCVSKTGLWPYSIMPFLKLESDDSFPHLSSSKFVSNSGDLIKFLSVFSITRTFCVYFF